MSIRSTNVFVTPLTSKGPAKYLISLYVIGTRKGVSASSKLDLRMRMRSPQ